MSGKFIANIDLVYNCPENGLSRFRELAAEAGAPLRDFDNSVNVDSFRRTLEDCNGIIVSRKTFLDGAAYEKALRGSIFDGKPCLVEPDPNHADQFTRLLSGFDAKVTRFGVFTADSQNAVRIGRSDDPTAFRDPEILANVGSIEVTLPTLIDYGPKATPIFTIPPLDVIYVDLDTDWLASWESPEMTCMVRTGPDPEHRNLAVLAGGLFYDRYAGKLGEDLRGIEINMTLAKNVISWLAGTSIPTDPAINAFSLVDSIERHLHQRVTSVLSTFLGDGWWHQGVPLPIRTKCAERREIEGEKLPRQGYLDLIDMKAIMEKNWTSFEAEMSSAGWSGGKAKSLAWFDKLNEIRRKVMHPAKRLFAAGQVTPDELAFLEDIYNRLRNSVA
jgi:hypothetical protein